VLFSFTFHSPTVKHKSTNCFSFCLASKFLICHNLNVSYLIIIILLAQNFHLVIGKFN